MPGDMSKPELVTTEGQTGSVWQRVRDFERRLEKKVPVRDENVFEQRRVWDEGTLNQLDNVLDEMANRVADQITVVRKNISKTTKIEEVRDNELPDENDEESERTYAIPRNSVGHKIGRVITGVLGAVMWVSEKAEETWDLRPWGRRAQIRRMANRQTNMIPPIEGDIDEELSGFTERNWGNPASNESHWVPPKPIEASSGGSILRRIQRGETTPEAELGRSQNRSLTSGMREEGGDDLSILPSDEAGWPGFWDEPLVPEEPTSLTPVEDHWWNEPLIPAPPEPLVETGKKSKEEMEDINRYSLEAILCGGITERTGWNSDILKKLGGLNDNPFNIFDILLTATEAEKSQIKQAVEEGMNVRWMTQVRNDFTYKLLDAAVERKLLG